MSQRPRIVLIAAMSENNVIGINNALPWRMPSDLRRFRALTMGHPVIMGRSTFQSIGCPLAGRETIILSRDPDFQAEGAHAARSFKQAIALASKLAGERRAERVFVAGGASVYAAALRIADEINLTVVKALIHGDAFFPAFDRSDFATESSVDHRAAEGDDFDCVFLTLSRRDPASHGLTEK